MNTFTPRLILTWDSKIKSEASTFCILYSNSISRDSHDCAKVFKNDTVLVTKWLINAIIRFWCIGNIYRVENPTFTYSKREATLGNWFYKKGNQNLHLPFHNLHLDLWKVNQPLPLLKKKTIKISWIYYNRNLHKIIFSVKNINLRLILIRTILIGCKNKKEPPIDF